MILGYKKILAIVIVLFLSGCSSVTGKIHNTEITNVEAKELYNAFEKMKLYEICEEQLIGGGDVNVTINANGEQISISGTSTHGMIFMGGKVYLADPFDDFFDLNYKIRNKYGLINSLMGITASDIYLYDGNKQAEIMTDNWQYMEELNFNIYYVGKDVSLNDLENVLGVEFFENGTVTELFEQYSKNSILKYENITIKRRYGINLWTEEEDFYFMVKVDY